MDQQTTLVDSRPPAEVCSDCASCVVTNTQEVAIQASAHKTWEFLSEVRNLALVHIPIQKVVVLEENKTENLRIIKWVQYSDWGRVKKAEEIMTVAVFNPDKQSGYIDNVRIQQIEPQSATEIMHFAHRFSISANDNDTCTLTEIETLQTHRRVIETCRSNTANHHVLLFTNIKRSLEPETNLSA